VENYTEAMSFFVQATTPREPRSVSARQVSILFAAILVAFSVAQLFSFEDFLVELHDVPYIGQLLVVLLPMLITAQVFAIPFLLGMTVSPAFRWVSMVFGWLVAAFWLGFCSWVVIAGVPLSSIGFLGSVVTLVPGWWAVMVGIALCILAGWSAWGLWPGKRR